MSLTINEMNVLRELATKYMEIAMLKVQRQKLDLWKSLNRSQMQRPMVCIDQIPTNEINVNNELTNVIRDPFWSKVEGQIRLSIYKWDHFAVDMVVEPFIQIPKIIEDSGYGICPEVKHIRLDEKTTASSQHYENVLNDFGDIEKIKDMQILYDKELSDEKFEEASEIFRGVAPIIQNHGIKVHLGVWDYLTTLMGMENALIDMYDRPDFLHACLERITQSAISGIKAANKLKVYDDISNVCHCSYVYTDELLPNFAQGKGAVSNNSWGYGLAQLFTSASPQFFEEFEFPYITRIANEFGMIYYGCCDRLDDRLEIVKKIPNVKKVSCSPWSDRKKFAEGIGNKLIMSNKPTPAFLATSSVNWDAVRNDLELTVELAKENNVNLEIILKDISTVRYEPERLTKWAEIAMEVVNG